MCQIAVLRGENAVAKTLQAAVDSLERDKVKLQSRVHSLEQKLEGKQNEDQAENFSGKIAYRVCFITIAAPVSSWFGL